MTYLFEATLTINNDDNNSTKSYYAMSFAVNKLREVGQNATIYDKGLKMHFEDRSARATVYEVELDNVFLDLDKSLTKAADFLRRTFYRYDWIQLRVNRQGKVLAVDNSKEITKQWSEIREVLTEDYKGKQTEDYIKQIDAQMATNDFSIMPFAQYFYFGLIFPAIPEKHSAEWQHSRIVGLSDFEDIKLSEIVRYVKTTDSQLREYSIVGNLVDTEGCDLKKYSGYIIVPCDDIHPFEAHIEVSYSNGDVDINWSLKLTQV